MNKSFRVIVLFVLCIDHRIQASVPYLNLRSVSANLVLEMVGQERYVHNQEAEETYTILSFTPGYFRSFSGKDLSCCLFGPDLIKSGDCAQITISGSLRTAAREPRFRGEDEWLADYFGLSPDFKSTIQFSPRIQNVAVDGSFYVGFNDCRWEGVYFRMHAPFVHTRWDLNFCEKISREGELPYEQGYFSSQRIESDRLLKSFTEFVVDCKTPDINPDVEFTDVFNYPEPLLTQIAYQPLAYARFAGCGCSPLTRNGLADLRFTLGYNPYMGDRYHVGFGLTGAAPTGNRPHAIYAFEPMIGNGNHWELGGQITAHYDFWESEDEESGFAAYLEANLTHMFKACQKRTLDLKNKPNSRYMLAQKLGTPVCALQATNVVGLQAELMPAAQFQDLFTPVANLTTVDVDVNIGAHIDMVLMFNYTSKHLSFDIGYNLWARSCERIKLNCDCPTKLADGQTWALKGDANVYGFTAQDITIDSTTISQGAPYRLSGTQSQATIHKGTNVDREGPMITTLQVVTASQNPGVDSVQYANVIIGDQFSQLYDFIVDGAQIMTSKNPIFLSDCDLDFDAAATKGLSHKLFANVSYQWLNKEEYIPFLGFGFSAEFAQSSADCCPSSKTVCKKECEPHCVRCGLSQWGVWIKGGFSFE